MSTPARRACFPVDMHVNRSSSTAFTVSALLHEVHHIHEDKIVEQHHANDHHDHGKIHEERMVLEV